jgi:hypothetical protein
MLYKGASKSRLNENPFDARSDQMQWKSDRDPRAALGQKIQEVSAEKMSEARWPGTVISGPFNSLRLARTQGGAAFCGQPLAPQRKEDNLRWPAAAPSGRRAASGLVGCKDGGPQCR